MCSLQSHNKLELIQWHVTRADGNILYFGGIDAKFTVPLEVYYLHEYKYVDTQEIEVSLPKGTRYKSCLGI